LPQITRRDRKQRVAGDPEVVARSVYVTGLTWDTEEDELIKHFSSVGPVVTAVVLRQRRNGNLKASMGCGVVEYETREAAAEAISVLNETELKGRAIRVREDRAPEDDPVEEASNLGQTKAAAVAPVSKSVKKVPRKSPEDRSNVPEPNKVFVTSLTSDVTNELLAEYFGTIGTVVSAEILSTRKGRSICSGIVCFEDNASVTESIAKLSNVDFRGRAIVVREYFI
jgi:RNA recognition motif-containing protein